MENSYKELPEGYVLSKVVDAKEDKKFIVWMNVSALLVMIIAAVPFVFIKLDDVKEAFNTSSVVTLISLAIFLVSMIAYVVFHELLHGLAYKILTKEKLTYGFTVTVAYCGVPNIYVSKKTALIALLTPFTVFTIALIPAILLTNGLTCFLTILLFSIHFSGCVGDLYCTLLLLLKFKGPYVLINDTGPKQSFYTKQ